MNERNRVLQPAGSSGQTLVDLIPGNHPSHVGGIQENRLFQRRPGQQVRSQIGGGSGKPALPSGRFRQAYHQAEENRVGWPDRGEKAYRSRQNTKEADQENYKAQQQRYAEVEPCDAVQDTTLSA